jgi:uncharacterized repeat protein (TIGR03803 family)
VLHSFGSSGGDGAVPFASLINVKGTLYGTTNGGGTDDDGTVFSLALGTGVETVLYSFCSNRDCTDGLYPYTGVIYVNGTLYGTTLNGGAYGWGILYALDPNTRGETVLHAFGRGTDGVGPGGPLTRASGKLYGVTAGGGANGDGTVYRFRP